MDTGESRRTVFREKVQEPVVSPSMATIGALSAWVTTGKFELPPAARNASSREAYCRVTVIVVPITSLPAAG